MEYALYALSKEPYEGFFPQDLLQWTKDNPTDMQIAEAYTIVNEHCTALMHMTDDNDIWGDQACQDWYEVEQELINLMIRRMKELRIPMPDKQGTYYIANAYTEHVRQKEMNPPERGQ